MIVLDTNVVSELMRPSPCAAVAAWVADHPAASLFLSAVGEAELRYGIAMTPSGQRRDWLASEKEAMLRDDFGDRGLPFDSRAARVYAEIASVRRGAGLPVTPADFQIAAIAGSRGLAVATRNVRHFEGIGIDILNPWSGT